MIYYSLDRGSSALLLFSFSFFATTVQKRYCATKAIGPDPRGKYPFVRVHDDPSGGPGFAIELALNESWKSWIALRKTAKIALSIVRRAGNEQNVDRTSDRPPFGKRSIDRSADRSSSSHARIGRWPVRTPNYVNESVWWFWKSRSCVQGRY